MTNWKSRHIQNDGVAVTIHRDSEDYTGKMIIAPVGRDSISDYSFGNRRMINALVESELAAGEIVNDGETNYLITAVKLEIGMRGIALSIISHSRACNAVIAVTRKVITYDDYGNITGSNFESVMDDTPCRADVVTPKMREVDKLLLDTTVIEAYVQNNSAVQLLDRATIAGTNYRIDNIDILQMPGVMVLQLSKWVG